MVGLLIRSAQTSCQGSIGLKGLCVVYDLSIYLKNSTLAKSSLMVGF
jgi:hypothetical protein